MTIKEFKDGSKLVTGDDVYDYLMSGHNYNHTCEFCKYEDTGDLRCGDCTIQTDMPCSCHINPPCLKCENSAFELSDNIVDFFEFGNGYKSKKSIKIDKELYDKFLSYKNDYQLSFEIISTGEKVFYVSNEDDEKDIIVEIMEANILSKVGINIVLNKFIEEMSKRQIMKKISSFYDNTRALHIDCTECNRGSNVKDENLCCAGWKYKKPGKGGCYIGTILPNIDLSKIKKLK